MECNHWVLEADKKKGRYTRCWWTSTPKDQLPKGVKHCGGTITARVEAIDEPFFGGTSASLSVEYDCDRCGKSQHYDELPSSYSLSDWLTKYIADYKPPKEKKS